MTQPSGGRAGVHGYEWLKDGYSLEEIESLRQQLLAQNDIGRVLKALRKFGISVKPNNIIKAVKQYNFDSPKIAFTYENYSAWLRLATGQGKIGDVAYLIHEIAEIKELQRIKGQTGFDFMGRHFKSLPRLKRQQWKSDFERYYREAHSKALEKEYEFIVEQVNRYINKRKFKATMLQVAAIDPTRYINLRIEETEAARHMFVDGVLMKEHHHYKAWCRRANELISLSVAMQQRLGYYREKIKLKALIALVKNKAIK